MNDQIDKLKEKVAKDPASKLFVPLAEEYRKAGRFDEAIAVLQAGLERQPDYMSGRVALGKIYLEKNMTAEAQAEFERVVEVIPDNLYAQRKLAEMYLEQGNVEQARAAFQTVLDLHPRDDEARKILDELRSVTHPAPGVGPGAALPEAAEELPELPPLEPEGAVPPEAEAELPELPTLPEEEEGIVPEDVVVPEVGEDFILPEPETTEKAEEEPFVVPAFSMDTTEGPGEEPFEGLERAWADEDDTALWADSGEEDFSEGSEEFSAEILGMGGEAPGVETVSATSDEEGSAGGEYEIPDDEEYDLSDLGVTMPERLTPAGEGVPSAELDEFRRSMAEEGPAEPEEVVREEAAAAAVDEEAATISEDDGFAVEAAEVLEGVPTGSEEEVEGITGLPEETGSVAEAPEVFEVPGGDTAAADRASAIAKADGLVASGDYGGAVAVLRQAIERAPGDKHLVQRAEELGMLLALVGKKAPPAAASAADTVIKDLEAFLEGFRRRRSNGI